MKVLEDTDACLWVSCEDRFGFRYCEGGREEREGLIAGT